MNAKQIRDYYEDKKEYKCPLTEYLIKSGYQQREGGYIAYAAEYSAAHPKDVIEVDYKKRLKVYFDRNKKYKLRFYFIGCSSEEFEFDFISRLSDGSSTDSTNEGSSYEYEEKNFKIFNK